VSKIIYPSAKPTAIFGEKSGQRSDIEMFPCCGRWSQSTKIKVRQISKFPRTGGYLPLCESMYLLMLSMYFIIKAIVLLCSGWCFSFAHRGVLLYDYL